MDGANDDSDEIAGPISNPVGRFMHLPEPTRQWLEDLREDDIEELKAAVRFYRTAKAVGKFNKWLMITGVGTFVGAVTFGEAIQKFLMWLSHADRH